MFICIIFIILIIFIIFTYIYYYIYTIIYYIILIIFTCGVVQRFIAGAMKLVTVLTRKKNPAIKNGML